MAGYPQLFQVGEKLQDEIQDNFPLAGIGVSGVMILDLRPPPWKCDDIVDCWLLLGNPRFEMHEKELVPDGAFAKEGA
jgi:hypothetical protein